MPLVAPMCTVCLLKIVSKYRSPPFISAVSDVPTGLRDIAAPLY